MKAIPSAALAAMYDADQALGVDPLAPAAALDVPAPLPLQRLLVEPADWSREEREQAIRDRPAEVVVEEVPARRPPPRREPT